MILEDNMSFTYYLRNKLNECHITQTQLAHDLKITKATVNKWLKSDNINPSEKNIKEVIEYFGDDYNFLTRVFSREKTWGEYFWKNLMALQRETHIYDNVPGINEELFKRYCSGPIACVELEDVKKIAKHYNCSVERLIDNSAYTNADNYNSIYLIGSEAIAKDQQGLNLNFKADFKIGTTEMEPIIHFGDQIKIKRDYITGEVVTTPKRGDIVVLKSYEPMKTSSRLLIRKYCIINNTIIYEANNPQFSPIIDSDNIEVVGIVSLSITQY